MRRSYRKVPIYGPEEVLFLLEGQYLNGIMILFTLNLMTKKGDGTWLLILSL
jgi:hypothetical protein